MSQKTKNHVLIIGSGFSSLSASCYLAKAGYNVTILERNSHIGGRARQLIRDGFTFDMGPTFYWMPDVFESFFKDFNQLASDYYELDRLNPAYQVYFDKDKSINIGDSLEKIKQTFEQVEPGSAKKLQTFIDQAEANYNLAVKDLVYQPGKSIMEIITWDTIKRLGLFITSIKKQVSKYVKHPWLQSIMEFPVLFLGGTAQTTPAFYNFMNYADFCLGTWHPKGGMYQVIKGMGALAERLDVEIITDCEVQQIIVSDQKVTQIATSKGNYTCDKLLSGADYHHTEYLLPQQYRQYSESYWDKKTFAPSALLFYVGFNKKLRNISHHTLFFDTPFEPHFASIYKQKQWPKDPLFYASFPSVTDATTAPDGQEAGIFLIPVAAGLTEDEALREEYFATLMRRLEHLTDQTITDSILFKECYGVKDFVTDYNAYKGNAYGLANTLLQTHILRPRLKSKKLKNLYFTGQLTLPGPGIPPSIISGKIAADFLTNDLCKLYLTAPLQA